MDDTNEDLPIRPRRLSPQEQDALLQELKRLGVHPGLLTRIAEHYRVEPKQLIELLIAWLLLLIHTLTDYEQPGTEALLQKLLSNQHTEMQAFLERAQTQVMTASELLEQTNALIENASHLLAWLAARQTIPNS